VRANKTDELKQGTMARTTRRYNDAALTDIMKPMEARQEMPLNATTRGNTIHRSASVFPSRKCFESLPLPLKNFYNKKCWPWNAVKQPFNMWARLTVSRKPASNISVNKHRECRRNACESVPLRGAVGMPPNTISSPSLPALQVEAPSLFPKLQNVDGSGIAILPHTKERLGVGSFSWNPW
jgi:hypothetical protein